MDNQTLLWLIVYFDACMFGVLIAQLIALAKMNNWPWRIYESLPWVRRRREREIERLIAQSPELYRDLNRRMKAVRDAIASTSVTTNEAAEAVRKLALL